MKKYFKLLEWIWIWETQAKIYLSLIEHWEMNITQIVEYSWLHRTQVYRLLPALLDSQLVIQSTVWKRKIYSWVSPNKIYQIYEQQQFNRKNIIDELEEKFQSNSSQINVVYKKWLKWIHESFNDILTTLNTWEVFYRITSELDVDKVNNYFSPKNYKKLRDEKQIERYIIMSEKTAQQKIPKLEREIKVIENNALDDNVIFTIYKDKVSLLDLNSQSSIIIQNKSIANFQKKIFQLLFKKI